MTVLNAFPCPSCGGSLAKCTDSRPVESFQGMRAIRRRRECSACGERHTTMEILRDDALKSRLGIADEVINTTRDLLRKNVIERLRGMYG